MLAYKHAKGSFTLPGIGKLMLVNCKARMGRNPVASEAIMIPAKTAVKFRVAKEVKDAILGEKEYTRQKAFLQWECLLFSQQSHAEGQSFAGHARRLTFMLSL